MEGGKEKHNRKSKDKKLVVDIVGIVIEFSRVRTFLLGSGPAGVAGVKESLGFCLVSPES